MDVVVVVCRIRKLRTKANRSRASTWQRSLKSTRRCSVLFRLYRHQAQEAWAHWGGAEAGDRHGEEQKLQPPGSWCSPWERPAAHESTFSYSKGNHPQTNQIITGAGAPTRWGGKGVQAIPRQGKARGNVEAIVIKEKEAALRRVLKGKAWEEQRYKQPSNWNLSRAAWRREDHEQNGGLRKGSDYSLTPARRKEERLGGL